jgi:hypothetical protein
MTVETDHGNYQFTCAAQIQDRISLRQRTLTYRATEDFVAVGIDINDPTIDPRSVRLRCGKHTVDRESVDESNAKSLVTFQVPTKFLAKKDYVILTPERDKKKLQPVKLNVQVQGRFECPRTFVYGDLRDNGELHFRLFLTGDVTSLDDEGRGMIEDLPLRYRITKRTSTVAIVDFAVPNFAAKNEPVEIVVGKQSFQLRVLVR